LKRESVEAFVAEFGRAPEWRSHAPGRVNLIGEHTDYTGGLVLPCAIDRRLEVLAARRDDGRVRVWARDLDPADNRDDFSADDTPQAGGWRDYIKAVSCAMRERGLATPGADLAITSELPRASGLSSSAALSVAVSHALMRIGGHSPSRQEITEVAHRAESHFVGTRCGVLDPMAVCFGVRDHALRIDCRSGERSEIPLPVGDLAILIADSGVQRMLAKTSGGDVPAYRLRVDECHEAFASAKAAGVGRADGESLRDLTCDDLAALEGALPSLLFRRARHVIRENERVDAVCRALTREAGPDMARVGALLREGQASLRDDFEASIPELDFLCANADALEGVHGSRLTGAGFGGCTLHLVAARDATVVARDLADAFASRFGRRPPILEVRAGDGAAIESV
jgi:galactokinase